MLQNFFFLIYLFSLQEKLCLATQKVVAKNLISLLKLIFATNSVVGGTAIAKAFTNDYRSCKRYLFFATCSIVAKDLSLQFLPTFLAIKKLVAKFSAFLATTFVVVKYLFFTTIQVVAIHDSQSFATT